MISLVRASGETFRLRVFDALEGARDAFLLAGMFSRRSVLPDHARPPRRAPRPDPPVEFPHFGLDSLNICRIQSPDTPRAGRVGAAPSGAAGLGGAGYDGTPLGRSGPETTLPLALQRIENTVLNDSSEARTV